MKRFLAILMLLVTLCGCLQIACGNDKSECNCENCTCCAGEANEVKPVCPCGCGKEQKQATGMPDLTIEWPETMTAPEVRIHIPPVICRTMEPHEVSLSAAPLLAQAPPGTPPPGSFAPPTPYMGFAAPIRA